MIRLFIADMARRHSSRATICPGRIAEMATLGTGVFPCRWHEHVEAWIANPYRAEMITISYESLKNDLLKELRKFCEFAGLDRADIMLETTARACSLDAMREKQSRIGWDSSVWPKEKVFVRRGKVGSFKDEMPPAAAMEFMRQAEPTLARAGYSIN
jgi:hypothetical protein